MNFITRFNKLLFTSSLLACLNVSAAETLSYGKETAKGHDFVSAVKSKSDATSFWGISCVVDPDGSKNQDGLSVSEALKYLSGYIKNSENFFNTAFLINIKNNQELISALSSSQDQNLQALAAAIMAMRANVFYYKSLIERNSINISENIEEVPAVSGKGKKKSKKSKKGKSTSSENSHSLDLDSAMLEKFLTGKNIKAQLYALQAAAYGADRSMEGIINNLNLKTPEALSIRLFYKSRIGQGINLAELNKIAALAMKKRATKPASYVSFSLDIPAMSYICQAIAETRIEEGLNILHASLTNSDLRVRVDAARAIERITSPKSMATVSKNIGSAPWPVLIELCNYSAKVPNKGMLPFLIQRLGKEKGRVRVNLNYAISAIAGTQHENVPQKWAEWYKKNKSFEVDPEATNQFLSEHMVQSVESYPNGYFYSLPIYSNSFIYTVDTSASMKGPRIESLNENMEMSCDQLLNKAAYNIVDFGGDVEIMGKNLTTDKRKGVARVKDWGLSGATRSFCAIRQSLLVPGVDSIYFLSDGAPVSDSSKNWEHISDGVMLLCRYMPIAIHCIDFDPKAGNQAYMINLAKYNEGRHESIDVGGAAPDKTGKKKKKKK